MQNNANLEKYLGERIFKRISELQGQLKQVHEEKAEHLDKIAELEAKLRVEAEEKVEYLTTIAEVQEKLKEARRETAEHLMTTWKLDEKLLIVEEEKVEYLEKISELEEELRKSIKRTGKAVQVSKSEERRISPAAERRSAERQTFSGTSSDTSGSHTSNRSMPPNSGGPESQTRRRPHSDTYCDDSDDSKSSSDDSISSRSKSSRIKMRKFFY